MSEQIAESANPFKKCANVECNNFVDADMSNLYCSQECLFTNARNEVREAKREQAKAELPSELLKDISKLENAIDILRDVAKIGTSTLFQIASLKTTTQEGERMRQIALLGYNQISEVTK